MPHVCQSLAILCLLPTTETRDNVSFTKTRRISSWSVSWYVESRSTLPSHPCHSLGYLSHSISLIKYLEIALWCPQKLNCLLVLCVSFCVVRGFDRRYRVKWSCPRSWVTSPLSYRLSTPALNRQWPDTRSLVTRQPSTKPSTPILCIGSLVAIICYLRSIHI